jgi:4-methylaminobutanoate oxidase (formaldehyde-forming)
VLWAAGREHCLAAAGYRAIDALRLEKGYRVWSSDITPEETPYEAGPESPPGAAILGRERCRGQTAAPWQLRCLVWIPAIRGSGTSRCG